MTIPSSPSWPFLHHHHNHHHWHHHHPIIILITLSPFHHHHHHHHHIITIKSSSSSPPFHPPHHHHHFIIIIIISRHHHYLIIIVNVVLVFCMIYKNYLLSSYYVHSSVIINLFPTTLQDLHFRDRSNKTESGLNNGQKNIPQLESIKTVFKPNVAFFQSMCSHCIWNSSFIVFITTVLEELFVYWLCSWSGISIIVEAHLVHYITSASCRPCTE